MNSDVIRAPCNVFKLECQNANYPTYKNVSTISWNSKLLWHAFVSLQFKWPQFYICLVCNILMKFHQLKILIIWRFISVNWNLVFWNIMPMDNVQLCTHLDSWIIKSLSIYGFLQVCQELCEEKGSTWKTMCFDHGKLSFP